MNERIKSVGLGAGPPFAELGSQPTCEEVEKKEQQEVGFFLTEESVREINSSR